MASTSSRAAEAQKEPPQQRQHKPSQGSTSTQPQQKKKSGAKQKELIISYIGKYIRQNDLLHENRGEEERAYEETLCNLREFLQYLEEKQIINCAQLEDKREVKNLIKDLVKLDLSKFSRQRKRKKGSAVASGAQSARACGAAGKVAFSANKSSIAGAHSSRAQQNTSAVCNKENVSVHNGAAHKPTHQRNYSTGNVKVKTASEALVRSAYESANSA